MLSNHTVHGKDARRINETMSDNSIDLVVTSPPYPMIEMWDEQFDEMCISPIQEHLHRGEGDTAFEEMHRELDKVWRQLPHIVVDGGIVCINVGDATRTIDGNFSVWPNAAKITQKMTDLGFQKLPEIIWRKPTNSGKKFLGSGMIPPNAYATLEHERILIFRNGKDSRDIEPNLERRYESGYFRDERNRWFSDLWDSIVGTKQDIDVESREVAAEYPIDIPHRLINMYSMAGDTVLDPFFGTGTTTKAAMINARDSVGFEIEEGFIDYFFDNVDNIKKFSRSLQKTRLIVHEELTKDEETKYEAENYDFGVKTKQEKEILLREVKHYSVNEDDTVRTVTANHSPVQREVQQ